MKTNFKNSPTSRFLLRSEYAIQVKIRKWLKFLNSVPFVMETLINHVYIRIWSSWLTLKVLQWMKTNFKISQFSGFLLKSEYPIQVKVWKWVEFLNSFLFIKKPLVNHRYIQIWLFWLTFTILQWMKKNSNISQFSNFLFHSSRKHMQNHVYIGIWSSWLTFTVLQWIKTNYSIFKISGMVLVCDSGQNLNITKTS